MFKGISLHLLAYLKEFCSKLITLEVLYHSTKSLTSYIYTSTQQHMHKRAHINYCKNHLNYFIS